MATKANKERGEAKLVLGGKEHTLRFDLNALVELEEALGVPLAELGNTTMSIKNVRSMLWAGVLHENEDITEKEIGKHVDMNNMEEVQTAISTAFASAKAKN
ncbi:GTA-gp10 family protein [Alkalicoccobacillus gibsonii]|uniref:GTA-gp10 family protein n=1 Tax=Alkalicoccobacillus gibsonii TaxID=79881 RepID=UPI0035139EDC